MPTDPWPSLRRYKHAVFTIISRRCVRLRTLEAGRHSSGIPYLHIQPTCSCALQNALRAHIPWECLVRMRSWCRIRAGLLTLTAINNRRSRARIQQCIFCSAASRNPQVHVLGCCPCWLHARTSFLALYSHDRDSCNSPAEIAVAVLRCMPDSVAFPAAVGLCTAVDDATRVFWAGR